MKTETSLMVFGIFDGVSMAVTVGAIVGEVLHDGNAMYYFFNSEKLLDLAYLAASDVRSNFKGHSHKTMDACFVY